MLIELLLTIIVIGFVGALLYIIQLQKELIVHSNHGEKTNVPQIPNVDPIKAEPHVTSDLNAATATETAQIQQSSVHEEKIHQIIGKSSTTDAKLLEDTKETERKWGIGSISKKFSSLTSTISTKMNTRAGKELKFQDQSSLNTALKKNIIQNSQIHQEQKSVKIFKLSLNKVSSNKASQIKKFEFGKSTTGSYVKNEKVVMILGATGSGKTTLINSLINYVFGVEYEDNFRFKLVTEDGDGRGNQAYSQTSWITAYTIHHKKGFKVPYTLTIIDTPGFGDTRGIERDTEITKQIHKFFTIPGKEGIDHIDAVGFVAQSSLPRLTFTQKYIFDQILSLFGKDIGENIYLLLTFADGKAPQVLNGINEAQMPYQQFFKFNNSVIFDDNTAEDEFATMFWKMGMRSFEKFFTEFSNIKSKSLTQTKSVLEERERIETQIEGLQSEIQKGLSKLEQLKKEVEVVEQHKADLARNKDFTYTVDEDSAVKNDLSPGTYVTNCLKCNFSCHNPCGIPDDGQKYGCAAMDGGGENDAKCKVCVGRCPWEQHKNMRYYFTTERKQVTKTSEDLKNRYLDASGKVKSANEIIHEMVDEFEAVQIKILGITEVLRRSINKLNEIALKPNPLSTSEYIRILIESEKSRAEPGWQDRVNHLNHVKEKVDNLAEIEKQGFDPFEAYRLKIQQERETKAGVWSAVGGYLQKINFW